MTKEWIEMTKRVDRGKPGRISRPIDRTAAPPLIGNPLRAKRSLAFLAG